MTEQLIDPEVYSDLCDAMGSEFAAELVATFLDDAPNMIRDLKEAAAGRDADGYRRAAHSIKSNADTFGASVLAAQAREMELSGLPEDDAGIIAFEATYVQTAGALQDLSRE